jgi:hypothetical protein
MTLDRGKVSYSEPKDRGRSYPSVALRHQSGRHEWSHFFVAETTYLPPTLPMVRTPHCEGKQLANRAKSVIRVRSESGHRTSFVGHPDGDNAADESGDEIDEAMPPKPFRSRFIAVLRSFLGVPRRFAGLQLTSSNRGYFCSRRSLSECMDRMTVPSWLEPKSRPLWMNSRGASLTRVVLKRWGSPDAV